MKAIVLFIAVSLILCFAGFNQANAQPWDYNAEWSVDNSNPNGVWTYGNVELATGDFYPYEVGYDTAPTGDRWENSAYDPIAGPDPEGYASKNTTGSRIDFYSWQPGQSWLIDQTCLTSPIGNHIPHFNGPVIGTLGTAGRFTAPVTGNYDVVIVFENRVCGTAPGVGAGLPTEVWVNINGSNVYAEVVSGFEDNPADNVETYFNILLLSAGDTIDFYVSSDYDETEPWTGGDHIVGISAIIDLSETSSPEPNLVLHLKANTDVLNQSGTPATNGQAVGKWLDQSDYDFIAKLEWGDPTLDTTGAFPVITFDGDDGLDIDPNDPVDPFDPNALKLKNFMVFVVGKINSAKQHSKIFFADGADAGFNVGISDNYPDVFKFYTNGDMELNSNLLIPVETDKYYLINGYRSGGDKKLYLNTNLEADSSGTFNHNDDVIATIGALAGGSQFLDGSIAEIQVWSDPNEYTRKQVEDALVSTYNIDTTPLEVASDTIFLTAITHFRCDQNGTETGERFGTYWYSNMWPIALYDSPIPANPGTDLLNNLPDMQLFEPIKISDGPRTFSLHLATPDGSGALAYWAINLFFNHSELQNEPWISAYVNMDPNLPGEAPDYDFMPNSASTTTGWMVVSTPGSGTTRYVYPSINDPNISFAVIMDDYDSYQRDAYNLDYVHYQGYGPNEFHIINDGPDGVDDNVAQFTVRLITATCEDIGNYYMQDFNTDCKINLDDFLLFTERWLWCNDPLDPTCTYPLP